MIVPNMTNSEIEKELLIDKPVVDRKTGYILDEIRRDVMKSKTFPITKTIEYTTPRKNTWLIVIKIYNKRDVGVAAINYHYNNVGLRAASLNPRGSSAAATFYNGHVFARYAERNKLDLSLPIDKMKDFFASDVAVIVDPNVDAGESVYGPLKNGGSLLGKLEGRYLIWNTYLTDDMLRDKQVTMSKSMWSSASFGLVRCPGDPML